MMVSQNSGCCRSRHRLTEMVLYLQVWRNNECVYEHSFDLYGVEFRGERPTRIPLSAVRELPTGNRAHDAYIWITNQSART
jgi:hypothetical protein